MYTALHLSADQEFKLYLAQDALEIFTINGAEETDDGLTIYLQEEISAEALAQALSAVDVQYRIEYIPEQNWNRQWEENFEPVMIDDYCYIKASFHPERDGFKHAIRITPKMSFGTGHHATTSQVIKMMESLPINDLRVLDFGTGTGVLAILAEKEGAAEVLAIDNDSWSVENTKENIEDNFCQKVEVRLSTLDRIQDNDFDLILANINRHILLDTMHLIAGKLSQKGAVLMSGVFTEDIPMILESAADNGLRLKDQTDKNNWACLHFQKVSS